MKLERKNILLNAATSYAAYFVAFGLSIIIARVLGSEGRGAVAQYFSLCFIFISFSKLGYAQWILANPNTAKVIGTKDISKMVVLGLPIVLTLYGITVAFDLFKLPFHVTWTSIVYSLLAVTNETGLATLLANGYQLLNSLSQIINPALSFLLSLLLLYYGKLNFDNYITTVLLAMIISTAFVFVKCKSNHTNINNPALTFRYLLKVAHSNVQLHMANVTKDISYRASFVFIGYAYGHSLLGIYSIAFMFMEVTLKFTDSIGIYVLKRSSIDTRNLSLKLVFINLLIISSIFFATYFVLDFVIDNIIGNEFLPGKRLFLYLLPTALLLGTWKIYVNHAIGARSGIGYLPSVLTSISVQFILLYLMQDYDLLGAVIAVSFSYLSMTLVLLYYYYRSRNCA